MSIIDNAIDGTENDMKSEKSRGPRSKYFYCINWKMKKAGPIESSSVEEATQIWADANDGVPPNVVDGGDCLKAFGGGSGYYLAKGTGMGDAQRISVTVSAKDMRFTTTRLKAEFKGWVVYANGIKGFSNEQGTFDDDELMMVTYDSLADESNKVSKQKLKKGEAIRKSDLIILDGE